MNKVLILGGAGYIGSKLYTELSTEMEITSVDLEWYGAPPEVKNFWVDYSSLNLEFLSRYDTVVLLAAHSSVKMADDASGAVENNIGNFARIVDKLNIIGAKKRIKLIYASSSSVYGRTHDKKSVETETSFEAVNPYDLSKKFNDDYISTLKPTFEYYGLRFGTVNGLSPHTRTDIMINSMYHNYLENGFIVCTNKETYRPILDIQDLVRVIKTIITCTENKSGIYNVASFNATVGQVSEDVVKVLGCKIDDPVSQGNFNSPYSFSIDCTKFEKAFNFKFEGTTTSILQQFVNNTGEYLISKRNEGKRYIYDPVENL